MRIFCVGRNYAPHAREMGQPVPKQPVLFTKPDTALLKNNAAFYLPDFSKEIHHEVELVVRICRNGKHIATEFARRYYDQVAVGIDFTARDLQSDLKKKGLPWDLAKGFDGSAPISKFQALPEGSFPDMHFGLRKNGKLVQQGQAKQMLFSVDYLVHFLSSYITLRTGDLLFTGTPEGVGPVEKGDHLQAFMEDDNMLECEIR